MSMSYDDCQDVLEEEKKEEVRQRLLGPIGQRPMEGGPRQPLLTLARKCVAEKARELLDNAELVEGYSKDGEHGETYHAESGWWIDYDFMGELEELVDDLKTIEEEGW
jgi:hypothetical protein